MRRNFITKLELDSSKLKLVTQTTIVVIVTSTLGCSSVREKVFGSKPAESKAIIEEGPGPVIPQISKTDAQADTDLASQNMQDMQSQMNSLNKEVMLNEQSLLTRMSGDNDQATNRIINAAQKEETKTTRVSTPVRKEDRSPIFFESSDYSAEPEERVKVVEQIDTSVELPYWKRFLVTAKLMDDPRKSIVLEDVEDDQLIIKRTNEQLEIVKEELIAAENEIKARESENTKTSGEVTAIASASPVPSENAVKSQVGRYQEVPVVQPTPEQVAPTKSVSTNPTVPSQNFVQPSFPVQNNQFATQDPNLNRSGLKPLAAPITSFENVASLPPLVPMGEQTTPISAEEVKKKAVVNPVAKNEITEAQRKHLENPAFELILKAREQYNLVNNYSAKISRRIHGESETLKKEQLHVRYRKSPMALHIGWEKDPGSGTHWLYKNVDGSNKLQAWGPPSGVVRMHMELDPQGEDALKQLNLPVDQFGIGPIIRHCEQVAIYQIDNNTNNLSYQGLSRVEGDEKSYHKVKIVDDQSGDQIEYYFDTNTFLPVIAIAKDQTGNELMFEQYEGVTVNQASLSTPVAFDAEALFRR